jgi:hypothetical protein
VADPFALLNNTRKTGSALGVPGLGAVRVADPFALSWFWYPLGYLHSPMKLQAHAFARM